MTGRPVSSFFDSAQGDEAVHCTLNSNGCVVSCARWIFRPDGKAVVTRGDLKITPPQKNMQIIYGIIH